MRRLVMACLTLDATLVGALTARAATDPLPVIVTYEMKRQRESARLVARNPRVFWVRQIMARIEERKLDIPKPLKKPAVVQLSFVLGRDGHLVSKSITKSSGSPSADKNAIALLERAQPFPPMPEAMSDQELTFNLPVRFR